MIPTLSQKVKELEIELSEQKKIENEKRAFAAEIESNIAILRRKLSEKRDLLQQRESRQKQAEDAKAKLLATIEDIRALQGIRIKNLRIELRKLIEDLHSWERMMGEKRSSRERMMIGKLVSMEEMLSKLEGLTLGKGDTNQLWKELDAYCTQLRRENRGVFRKLWDWH